MSKITNGSTHMATMGIKGLTHAVTIIHFHMLQ